MPDLVLAEALREALGLAPNSPIERSSLEQLTELDAQGAFFGSGGPEDPLISDLTGLECATGLRTLDLSYNRRIVDLEPLRNLSSLETLKLSRNQIESIDPLAELDSLRVLMLAQNAVSSVEPLQFLTNLTELDITALEAPESTLSDLSALRSLTELQSLRFSLNEVSDVEPLAQMPQLHTLVADFNLLTDLSVFETLPSLTHLDVSYNCLDTGNPALAQQIERLTDRGVGLDTANQRACTWACDDTRECPGTRQCLCEDGSTDNCDVDTERYCQ